MKRLLLTTFLLIVALVFLGAGCVSKSQKTTMINTTTTTAEVIKKKPQTSEPSSPAYDYCEKTGNELIIRFNKAASSSIAYCRFADATECEAEKYFRQTCAPGQGAKPYQPQEEAANFTTCTNEYQPVCGADGVNYTNACLAQTQGIIIAHTGVCTPAEQKTTAADITPNNKTNGQTTQDNQPAKTTDTSEPGWLTVVKDFALSAPKSDPPAFIEKCAYSGNTSYYFSPGCDGCITTLYNKDGKVTCYPSNDLDNTCPAYFTGAYRANYCAKVWKDSRQ